MYLSNVCWVAFVVSGDDEVVVAVAVAVEVDVDVAVAVDVEVDRVITMDTRRSRLTHPC